jgi:uncharacterized repeat protein (TIGR03803 family)
MKHFARVSAGSRSRWLRWLSVPVATLFCLSLFASAQNFSVLHTFTGGIDGGAPGAGLVLGSAGKFYGTTTSYGCEECAGTVFSLKSSGSGWTLTTLYAFPAGEPSRGESPMQLTIAPNGSLYGPAAGGSCDPPICGVIFRLQPPSSICRAVTCPWFEDTLYEFDVRNGDPSAVIFDESGNLYAATRGSVGGACQGGNSCGSVFEISPSQGYQTLYSFTGGSDGSSPNGVLLDRAGNFYGTTYSGGINNCYNGQSCGTIFELSPSEGGWTLHTLYLFTGQDDGGQPAAALAIDSAGHFYGTTTYGGANGGGTVFELTPSNGSWTLSTLHSFAEQYAEPVSPLAVDSADNLYGTTANGGSHGQGNVFMMTESGNNWVYSSLHDFTGGADGAYPDGPVIVTDGNIYGTAAGGGLLTCEAGYGCGVIFEITP